MVRGQMVSAEVEIRTKNKKISTTFEEVREIRSKNISYYYISCYYNNNTFIHYYVWEKTTKSLFVYLSVQMLQ